MDTFTAANLFVGHATGVILLLLFVWLMLSELMASRAVKRLRARHLQRREAGLAAPRVKTAENVSPLSFR